MCFSALGLICLPLFYFHSFLVSVAVLLGRLSYVHCHSFLMGQGTPLLSLGGVLQHDFLGSAIVTGATSE